MFVTTRDTGGRRRTKSYASNTTAKSSKTSLSSVFTVGSAGSNDSSSTVTQSSYNRSQHKRRKRPKEHRRRTSEFHKENKNKSVDVFDFLVEKHASEESLPLSGPTATDVKDIVEDVVEYESDIEEPEELDDSEELEGIEEPEESEELEESEEPEESDELDEVEETRNLEELDDLEDLEEPDELEECERSPEIETEEVNKALDEQLDEDLDEPAEPSELDEIRDRAESPNEDGGDSEDDRDHGDKEDNGGSDNSDNSDNESDDDKFDTEPLTPDIVIHKEDSDPEVYYRSMSDSGISMGSCSIDASIASLPPRLPILREESARRPSSQPRPGNELAVVDPRWAWNTSPGPFHEGFIPPPAPMPPPMMYDMPMYHPQYPPYTPYGTPPPMPEDEIRGPAIKIREPSHVDIKPKCFRSFTKMSTRLILQLQDDIAELEGELSVLDGELDAIEADSSSDEEGPPRPGTARHMLKARECEIYQELRCKIDEYSNSLESMQKIEKISQPAILADLTKHHRWLESRISPSFRARHLVGNDLRTLSTTKLVETVAKPAPSPGQDTQFMAYSALVNTLLPLIAFKLVSSVLNRLILLIIMVIVGATVQDRTKTSIRAEDMNCILVCVGISVFAAFFL